MKVLIFTVTAGNGHNATANILKEKLIEKYNADVKIVDAYKTYAGKIRSWAIDKGYLISCNHFVKIYNAVFKKCEKSAPENRNRAGVHGNTYPVSYGVLKEIFDFQPDLIIPTHIFIAVALTNLKKVYNIPAKILALTLDYGVSPYWECAIGVDYMTITDNYMKQAFLNRGFKEEQLYPIGIPVKDIFSVDMDKKAVRNELKFSDDLFTLTIMKSGFFSISDRKIMSELEKISQKLQIVIINGKSKNSRKQFDKLIKKTKSPHIFHNLGFTDKIGELFSASDLILGKAGGLTVTETITKALPSLITGKLPQQEVYNKEYLINNNCGLSINKRKGVISKQMKFLLENPDEFKKMSANCKKIRKLYVLDSFMEILKNLPKADYNDFKIDKKSIVKQKIKHALKQNIM